MDIDNSLTLISDGVNDFYKDLLFSIIDRGEEISPRGLSTKEIRPAMIILEKPRERFLTCPGRNIHPYFQYLESIWILGGRGDLDFIKYYLKNMETYADNMDEFNAPYGVRMRSYGNHRSLQLDSKYFRDQFWDCYQTLRKDTSTRQAAIVFWNPHFDNFQIVTNDRPCNIAMAFITRDEHLDFTIFCRSNDLNWGLANTNVVQFSVILETMALLLDLYVGRQTHMINSLHVYDSQGELTQSVLNADYNFNVYDHIAPMKFHADFDRDNPFLSLSTELSLFFEYEKSIREGFFQYPYEGVSFNFLRDGLILAESFFFYKHGNYVGAMSSLLDLKAYDIYISVMEFISRKIDNFSLVKEKVLDHFEKATIKEESLSAILNYIERH